MKSENPVYIKVDSHIDHKILKQDGYAIHYFGSGKSSNELIIFLHPAFGDHRCFDKQFDTFSQNYRVITIDLLGHGLSQASKGTDKLDSSVDHILSIMEIEGFANAHFVGVSMGTLIGQYFALNYPEKVRSMTILGGYDINSDNKEVLKAQRAEGLKWIFKALFSMRSFRKYLASVTVINPEEQAKFYDMASLYTRRSFRVMSGLGKIIQRRNHIKHDYPIMLMTGDHDLELVKKVSGEWKESEPEIEFHIIPNSGHCANMDNAETFNALLADFIGRKPILNS